jgi:serine/threonine protein kinase
MQEMRDKVENAFHRQIPEDRGLVPRDNFTDMLEALGLSKEEAALLLNECDPLQQSHLWYSSFLDFIFAPGRLQSKGGNAISESSAADVGTVDKPADDAEAAKKTEEVGQTSVLTEKVKETTLKPESISDQKVADDEKASDVKAEVTEAAEEAVKDGEATKRTSKVNFLDTPPEDKEEKEGKQTKDVKSSAKCARKDCQERADGNSKYCSLDCLDQEAEETFIKKEKSNKQKKRMKMCFMCSQFFETLYNDPNDNQSYCEGCWINYYGSAPSKKGPALVVPTKLVGVVRGKCWHEDKLIQAWHDNPIKDWPGGPYSQRAANPADDDLEGITDMWFPVRIRLNPGLVGSHARTCTTKGNRPSAGELLCDRYQVEEVVGAGHFTRALLATDITTGKPVCVKKHNSITVELLTDLLTICHRLKHVDPDGAFFPQMFDAFYDIDGYTVESLISGQNCLLVGRSDPMHFKNFDNLRVVAKHGYQALVHMCRAGVVHTDLKADNIMWIHPTEECPEPSVRLVDFGCSRLDCRIEGNPNTGWRNWAFSEGGAGHVGKWAPEMMLRLQVTHKADVWGLAVALLELHCGRAAWCGESDTVEVVLAQMLGLTNSRSGLPPAMLKQSPLDIRQLYTPHPAYFPVQRYGTFGLGASFQEMRPATWGLGVVMGDEDEWNETQIVFADFIGDAMQLDPNARATAAELMTRAFISPSDDAVQRIVADFKQKKAEEEAERRAKQEAAAAEAAAREAEAVAREAEAAAQAAAQQKCASELSSGQSDLPDLSDKVFLIEA